MRTKRKIAIEQKSAPKVELIKTDGGQIIRKCCLSCMHYESGDEEYCFCNKDCIPVRKDTVNDCYCMHPKYDKIGNTSKKLKPRAYYTWRLEVIKKFTRGGYTDWKKYDAYCDENFGSNMFKYWLNNIR